MAQARAGTMVERLEVQFRLDGEERGGQRRRAGEARLELPDAVLDPAVVLRLVAGAVDGNDEERFEKFVHQGVAQVLPVVPLEEQRRAVRLEQLVQMRRDLLAVRQGHPTSGGNL